VKKPWNLSDVTIYSIASYDTEQEVNMNICTYVTPISMAPKLYSIAIYRNTKTLENCLHSQKAVLQILSKEQIQFVNTFGKKSGLNYNKKKYLDKKQVLTFWENQEVLKECAAYVLLEKVEVIDIEESDHILFIYNVLKSKTNHKNLLTLQDLRDKKLVRI
jgi:flavin reductase (DIM6/NTAB) family NADH-FMN oxidoreductase RutF